MSQGKLCGHCPRLVIEEGLRNARGIVETAQGAVAGDSVSAAAICAALGAALRELERVSQLFFTLS